MGLSPNYGIPEKQQGSEKTMNKFNIQYTAFPCFYEKQVEKTYNEVYTDGNAETPE
jgi:hypothetical protein